MNITLHDKKIVHITCTPGRGGIASILLPLWEDLNKNCKLEIISFSDTPIIEMARDRGLAVKVFQMKGKIGFGAIYKAYKYLKTKNIDLLHSSDYKSDIITWLLSKTLRVPSISTLHGLAIFTGSFKLKLYGIIDYLFLRYFDQVITISKNTKDVLIKFGLNSSKVKVIYNGIKIDDIKEKDQKRIAALKNNLGITDNDRVIGIFARLVALKGHQHIIEALPIIKQQFSDIKLLIVGEGILERKLKEIVHKKSLEKNVIFAGYRTEIKTLYSLIEVLIHPALYEGFGLSMVEAMANGKPVVATNVFAIPEVIEDKITGLLVPSKDPAALAEAICSLFEDKAFALRIGLNGKKRASEMFTIEKNIKSNIDLYKELLTR